MDETNRKERLSEIFWPGDYNTETVTWEEDGGARSSTFLTIMLKQEDVMELLLRYESSNANEESDRAWTMLHHAIEKSEAI